MTYDYLIVGAGFFGSICAYELNKAGKKVCVVDSRDHIGGNCYTKKENGINIHTYGPHVFHTSNKEVWDWVNQFTTFNNFQLNVVANYKNELYPLPFNMFTFNKLWNVNTPYEAKMIIKKQSSHIDEPSNLEEQAIKLVGTDVYQKLIKGYTIKQWKKHPKDLPKEIIKRLPVRYTFNNDYFNDLYQGIPEDGYTIIFEKMLTGIDVFLNTDYFKDSLPKHDKVIYTGPIDRFFNYRYGYLEYKTTKFVHKYYEVDDFQGVPFMTFTDEDIPYTRIVEHKHFEKSNSDGTWITYEYPANYLPNLTEPYYPVNDEVNNTMYQKYLSDAEKLKDKYLFGGRLAEYKYYDMHQVIESALKFIKKEITK